jgi:hypothetical protein
LRWSDPAFLDQIQSAGQRIGGLNPSAGDRHEDLGGIGMRNAFCERICKLRNECPW